MASIFISYRRADSAGHAGRLCDRLTSRFGDDRVFLDIEDITPGQNFAEAIDRTIATCDCVIAMIGPQWAESIRARAESRDDYVRHEIGAALRRGVLLIPVLVGGARMPSAPQLPPEFARLSLLNAVEIRDESFDKDVEQLEGFLAHALHATAPALAAPRVDRARRAIVVGALGVLVLASGGYVWMRSAPRAPVENVPAIDGTWIADMRKANQQPYRLRITLQRVGSSYGGVVEYPTGDGPMHDIVLTGRTLTFATTHTPQFASAPATIRFQAELVGEELRLTSVDDNGLATGVARRAR